MVNKNEINAYVLCNSGDDPKEEIRDEAFFHSLDEAKAWIEKEDPKKELAWDIYSVDVDCVFSL